MKRVMQSNLRLNSFDEEEKMSMAKSLYEMWESGEYTPQEAAKETGFSVEYCRNKFAAWDSAAE